MAGSFKVKLKWPKDKKEADETVKESTQEISKVQKKRKTQRSCATTTTTTTTTEAERGHKSMMIAEVPRTKKFRNSEIEETNVISKDYEIIETKKNTPMTKKQSKTQKINKKTKLTEEKMKNEEEPREEGEIREGDNLEKEAKYEDLLRVIEHLQKLDKNEIFKEPVTEEVAPGYFSVIKNPMDFHTIKTKLNEGKYITWDLLLDDFVLMLNNAMAYNEPNTFYYKQAKTLMPVAERLIELGRQGVKNFRGKTSGLVRAHNAQVAADERAEKNAIKAVLRQQRTQVKKDKLIQKAAANGILFPYVSSVNDMKKYRRRAINSHLHIDGRRAMMMNEDTRGTYHSPIKSSHPLVKWGGFVKGSNAEGTPFISGMSLSRNHEAGITRHAYVQSLVNYSKEFKGIVLEHVLQRIDDCQQFRRK